MSYALVSHASAHSTNSTGGGTTSAIDTTGASLLVAVCAFGSGSSPTMSDSKSNTWVQRTDYGGAQFMHCSIFYAKNPTVGTGHTFTMGGALFSTYGAVAVSAFSGADTTAPYDVENGAFESSGATLASGSITPSAGSALIVAGYAADQLAATISIDSSFTILETQEYANSQNSALGLAYLIQTSAASVNPTWTRGQGSASQSAAAIASFKAAGGGGGSSFTQSSLRLNQAVKRATTW